MRSHFLIPVLAVLMAQLAAGRASAQDMVTPAPFGNTVPAPGWTFIPAAGVSQLWDDNVLVQGKGSDVSGDFVSVFAPHAGLDFNSPRNTLSASYNGAFELYRQYDGLNNYGQFETLSARHQTTARTSVFLQQQFAMTPTTDLPLLVGVPFVRLGAREADAKAGINHAFTKRTSIEASYDYQWISFDKDPALGTVLIGGHGHTLSSTIRHQLTARTTLIADYDVQHAVIVDGSTFTVQNARAGAEHRVSATFTVFAEAGAAHVATSGFAPAQTSPSVRAGATKRLGRRFELDGMYSRLFVPAFGVGDTLESSDVGGHLKAMLSHRVYTEGSVDWRHDNPLTGAPNLPGEAPLRSLWYSGLVGYVASPWLRIEGFFNATHQNADRPGGELDRDRVGIQVTTTKPMRVR